VAELLPERGIDSHRGAERVVVGVHDAVAHARLVPHLRERLGLLPVKFAWKAESECPGGFHRQAGNRKRKNGRYQDDGSRGNRADSSGQNALQNPSKKYAGNRGRGRGGLSRNLVLSCNSQASGANAQMSRKEFSRGRRSRENQPSCRQEICQHGEFACHVPASAGIPVEVPDEMDQIGRGEQGASNTNLDEASPGPGGEGGQKDTERGDGGSAKMHVHHPRRDQDRCEVLLFKEEMYGPGVRMKIQPEGTPTKKGPADQTQPVSKATANRAAQSPPKRRGKPESGEHRCCPLQNCEQREGENIVIPFSPRTRPRTPIEK